MQLVDCLRFSTVAGAHTTEGCGSIANSRLTRARRAREADERFLSSCSPLGLNRPGVMLVMNFRSRVCDSRAQPWQCHTPKRLVGLGVCLFASTRLTLTSLCHDMPFFTETSWLLCSVWVSYLEVVLAHIPFKSNYTNLFG